MSTLFTIGSVSPIDLYDWNTLSASEGETTGEDAPLIDRPAA